MATQSSSFTLDIANICARLFRESEMGPRARAIAQSVADALPNTAVNVYLVALEGDEQYVWTPKASVGGAAPDHSIPLEAGALGNLARLQTSFVVAGSSLLREEYAHLNVRRTLQSLACLPMICESDMVGAIEILSFEIPLSESQLGPLQELADLAGNALMAARSYEEERNGSLTSINRLTQFYDVEKVFSSTLEMDQLLPIIGSKIRDMLECEAVNVWLVKGDESVELMHQAGSDSTTAQGMNQRPGEGIAGDVSDNGEPVVITDDADPRLATRNHGHEQSPVSSLISVALMDQGSLVGVLEAVNKADGSAFDDDDLFVLTSLSETACSALHNASLLMAERKVQILQTLVQVSTEITSTLNLDRVLQAVVNTPSAVIPYERAAVALDQRGKLQLKAISGMEQITAGASDVEQLQHILPWVSQSAEPILINQRGDEIDASDHDTMEKFREYFAETGVRSFYALPLADDEGRLGTLSFESSQPDFLTDAHLEMIKVLAGQATVAVRNASLYKEVPFIGLLEPLLQKKQKFLALEKRRRTLLIGGAVALAAFLVLCPFPMRVDGNATVASARTVQIQPEIEGVVREVHVREGQHVQRGDVLADLEDWNYRAALASATAKYRSAMLEMNRALASNDGMQAGVQRVQSEYWVAEVKRCEERLERTHLRALFDGWVTTPHVEDLVGKHLEAGDTFAELVDSQRATVDVAIEEPEFTLLRPGKPASIKLESFPSQTFRGDVTIVSPKSRAQGDDRFFYARVDVPNQDGRLRPGMQGRGKVWVGWRPVGYVLFRRPFLWAYSKIWNWVGW